MQRNSTASVLQKINPNKIMFASLALLASVLPKASAASDVDDGSNFAITALALTGILAGCGTLLCKCCCPNPRARQAQDARQPDVNYMHLEEGQAAMPAPVVVTEPRVYYTPPMMPHVVTMERNDRSNMMSSSHGMPSANVVTMERSDREGMSSQSFGLPSMAR